jgi:dTDP-L-rhamnose 4-epimerase
MGKSKRILVTGGAGFIGSHIVDALVKEGHKVRILDNLEPQVHSEAPRYLNPEAEFVNGDIRSEDDVKNALRNIEVVSHHTAAVGVGQSMYQIQKYVDVNTGGTARLLDTIVNGKYDIEKMVVASSMSIYGEGAYRCSNCGIVYPKQRSESQLEAGEWDLKCPNCDQKLEPAPTDEDKPLHPTSVYAISKRDQEELCLSVGRAYKIPAVALRYFNAYGPRQSLSNPYTGVCAIFLSRIKNDKRPLIYEDGVQSRDFVSVHDIVRANLLAMSQQEADYEAFNVGTGKPISIMEIARMLVRLCGKLLEPEIISKYRAGDIRHCYPDISKIRTKLGYSPQVNLEDGMRELIEWGEYAKAVDKTAQAQAELTRKGLIQ